MFYPVFPLLLSRCPSPLLHATLHGRPIQRAPLLPHHAWVLQVKKCEKAIRAAHAANAELLSTTKTVMSLPLPQVRRGAARFPSQRTAGGGHGWAEQAGGPAGGLALQSFSIRQLLRLLHTHRRLQAGMHFPLSWGAVHWHSALHIPACPPCDADFRGDQCGGRRRGCGAAPGGAARLQWSCLPLWLPACPPLS